MRTFGPNYHKRYNGDYEYETVSWLERKSFAAFSQLTFREFRINVALISHRQLSPLVDALQMRKSEILSHFLPSSTAELVVLWLLPEIKTL